MQTQITYNPAANHRRALGTSDDTAHTNTAFCVICPKIPVTCKSVEHARRTRSPCNITRSVYCRVVRENHFSPVQRAVELCSREIDSCVTQSVSCVVYARKLNHKLQLLCGCREKRCSCATWGVVSVVARPREIKL